MQVRKILAVCVVYATLSLGIKISYASTDPVTDYVSARRTLRQPALTSQMLTAIQQNPNDYEGRAVEISGSVIGIVETPESRTALISVNSNSISLILPANLRNADWINSGRSVRVLVSVEHSNAEIAPAGLRLIAAAPEYDVAQWERSDAAGWQRRSYSTSRSLVYSVRQTPQSPMMATNSAVAGAMSSSQSMSVPSTGGAPVAPLGARARAVYGPYRDTIRRLNPRLSENEVDKITTSILYFSDLNQIDPRLIVAMIIAESGFNINSTSRTGAMGLGQLMPSTARGMGVTDAYDPVQNIAASVRILRGHLDNYGGAPANAGVIPFNQIALTMAAYNAGPGAVHRYHGVPPYRETKRYVARVASLYKQMCGQ